jgi:S1-C subfamily serine protease
MIRFTSSAGIAKSIPANTKDFFATLEEGKPNDEVTLTILRDGRRMALPITLGQEG